MNVPQACAPVDVEAAGIAAADCGTEEQRFPEGQMDQVPQDSDDSPTKAYCEGCPQD